MLINCWMKRRSHSIYFSVEQGAKVRTPRTNKIAFLFLEPRKTESAYYVSTQDGSLYAGKYRLDLFDLWQWLATGGCCRG